MKTPQAPSPRRVVITGVAGTIGRVLDRGLGQRWEVVGVDRRAPIESSWTVGDVRDIEGLVAILRNTDAVIHLAATSRPDTRWSSLIRDNVDGTRTLFEAARQSKVRKVVFASSNHVTKLFERDPPYADLVAGHYDGLEPERIPRISHDSEIRPDGEYGASKAFGEALGRYYADAFGLQVLCLRIGSVNSIDRPRCSREFATFLTHRDLVGLVEACLQADEPRFGVFYGVSNNTWRFWDLDHARKTLGWTPQDNAEEFRRLVER